MLEPKRFDHLTGFDGLSERSLREHYKLYTGYVQRYNELMDERAAINAVGKTWVSSDHESLKVDITFALGAIKNHELFFDILGSDAGDANEPTGLLAQALVKSFNSVPQYLVDLKQTAVTGRGWVWTAYDLDQKYLFNYDAGAGNGIPVWNSVPILAIDLFGHAYFYDFGNNKTAYVETVMSVISWKRVAEKLAAAIAK